MLSGKKENHGGARQEDAAATQRSAHVIKLAQSPEDQLFVLVASKQFEFSENCISYTETNDNQCMTFFFFVCLMRSDLINCW